MIIQTEHWESCWFFIQFILQVKVFNGHLMSKIPGNAYWVALLLFGCSLLRQCFLTQTFSTAYWRTISAWTTLLLFTPLCLVAGVGMIIFISIFLLLPYSCPAALFNHPHQLFWCKQLNMLQLTFHCSVMYINPSSNQPHWWICNNHFIYYLLPFYLTIDLSVFSLHAFYLLALYEPLK